MIGFQTLSTSVLVPVAKMFNIFGKKNEKKGISQELAEKELSAKALAFWFMDDGSKGDWTSKKGKQIHLHTHAFTLTEVKMLCNSLITVFALKAAVKPNKGAFIVLISGHSYEKFLELVNPFIVPSFRYKLPFPRSSSMLS